jgi:ribosomal protein L12E/L44/L45/RPP1/RPP2
MTRDLAFTVIRSFSEGEPVTESMLIKAAEYLQLDSKMLISEARFKTAATQKIKELQKGHKLTEEELKHFSTAVGVTKDHIRKVASLNDTTVEDVLFTYFRQTGYVPYTKYANDETNIDDVTLQQDPAMLDRFQIKPHSLTSQDPFGNPLVQPSPQSVPQVPSMSGGNLEQLKENYDNKDQIEQEQLELANQQMLQQEGQQPGSHSKEEIEAALSQADSIGKAQFIMPGGTEDQLQRLSQEIDKVEQMAQLPIKDPAQLKKIMGEIEKADKKLIDEAIKSISESNAGAATGGSGYGPLPPPANSAPQENQSTDADMQKLANILRKIRF